VLATQSCESSLQAYPLQMSIAVPGSDTPVRFRTLCGIIPWMLVRFIGALTLLLALGLPSAALPEHSAKVGPLVITATGISNAASGQEDSHAVVVFVTVANSGQTAACSSFSAELKGTYDLEYSKQPGAAQAPGAPQVWQMLPGEESKGAYVFDVKNGVDPRELLVMPQSKSVRCELNQQEKRSEASVPEEVTLDIHDLPPPQSVEYVLTTDTEEGGGTPKAGEAGYGFSTCLDCPLPAYSADAIAQHVQGSVVLQATITPQGSATDIHVSKGLGFGLDEKATDAVRTWRFKPALGPNQKPASVRQDVLVDFQLY
jgi:TonB family protein